MITLHFAANGKLCGIRDSEGPEFIRNDIPPESITTLVFDRKTNIQLWNDLHDAPQRYSYVNGELKRNQTTIPISPPSADESVKHGIKSQARTVLNQLRDGTAVFDLKTQRVLFYLLMTLLKDNVS